MEKKRRLSSLKKKIIVFVILCWGVPIAVFFAYTTSSYRKGIIEKTEGLMEDQLENMASFASIRIEDAITLCQRPSYEKTWENAWKKYLRGDYSRNDYLQDVYTSLRGKFYLDERFNMYAYYCYGTEDPESFSSRTGISLKSYVDEIQPYLKDIIDSDSAYACVRVVDGRIFIVRNLYTTMDYTRYGTLVVELAQLSRPEKQGKWREPTMHDLKETGQLEQDADAILLLSSDGEAYQCILAKNKEGRVGEVPLTFDKTRQRFLALTSELERR